MLPSFVGMLPVLLLAGLILALSIPGTVSESATLRFLGQTEFVVNESSTAVVRLVVERVGDPVNVTALVLVRHRTSSSPMTHCASILIKLSNPLFCLYVITLLCCWALCPVKERIGDLFGSGQCADERLQKLSSHHWMCFSWTSWPRRKVWLGGFPCFLIFLTNFLNELWYLGFLIS